MPFSIVVFTNRGRLPESTGVLVGVVGGGEGVLRIMYGGALYVTQFHCYR